MKIYLNEPDAVSDLHKNGFTNDFQLSGNDLLWVQENFFIRDGEFDILEYHNITEVKSNEEFVVFGIIAPHHNIKGILVNHYKSYTNITAPVIIRKLNDLNTHAQEQLLDIGKNILNNDPLAN
jgi:flagellar assembly factor FliW